MKTINRFALISFVSRGTMRAADFNALQDRGAARAALFRCFVSLYPRSSTSNAVNDPFQLQLFPNNI